MATKEVGTTNSPLRRPSIFAACGQVCPLRKNRPAKINISMDAANGEQLIFRVFFSQHFVNVKKSLRERSESVEHFGIRLFPFCGKPFFLGG